MVIRALKKWCSDLLGIPISVYTDHRTLESFDTQCDLSWRQLHWQEFMSQYDMTMVYILGKDNTVADGLSQVPDVTFPGEITSPTMAPFDVLPQGINATLTITMDPTVLQSIQEGYQHDEFCKKLMATAPPNLGITNSNGL